MNYETKINYLSGQVVEQTNSVIFIRSFLFGHFFDHFFRSSVHKNIELGSHFTPGHTWGFKFEYFYRAPNVAPEIECIVGFQTNNLAYHSNFGQLAAQNWNEAENRMPKF